MDNRPDKFHAAVALHQRGHLRQAQALYQEILEDQADHFDALHFLGVIAAQSNDPRRAVDLIGRAVALNPNDPVGQSEQLVVYLNGRSSYPAVIPVVNPGD